MVAKLNSLGCQIRKTDKWVDFDKPLIHSTAKAFFDEIDADGNGQIDVDELKMAFEKLDLILKKSEVEMMIHEADADGDGFLDVAEFQTLVVLEIKRFCSLKHAAVNQDTCNCVVL